jgi:glycosyltransferase involved in cell wall biosynthesis
LVRENETGFFARTADDWTDRLRRLLADPLLAERMGERGRALVEEHYEASAVGSRLADLVAGAVERRPPAAPAGG